MKKLYINGRLIGEAEDIVDSLKIIIDDIMIGCNCGDTPLGYWEMIEQDEETDEEDFVDKQINDSF